MKTKTLLAKAALCTTDAEANQFLTDVFMPAFTNIAALKNLDVLNESAYMEGKSSPHVNFEMNQVISQHYITMVKPEIRDQKLVLVIDTNHMLDGLGTCSQKWKADEDLNEVIEATGEDTVTSLAKRAKNLAIANHAALIERLGVSSKVAQAAARKSW